MKKFFSNVLAAIVGGFIVLFICFIMFFFIIGLIAGSSSDQYVLKENTVFTLKLDGILKDRVATQNPLLEMFRMDQVSEIGLDDILSSIKKAKENDKIKGIYIHSGMFSASPASILEIRNALIDFKESGKFIVSYADTYTQGCYYLASVSDKVILNPQGHLDLHGLSLSPTYYKGLLDKIGVEMQIFKVGTYKSAVEPFSSDKMSDANREQLTSFANDIWSTMTADISKSRGISAEMVNTLVDTMLLFQDQKFLIANKVVDTLLYETEVKEYLKTLVGIETKDKLLQATLDNMTTVPLKNKSKSKDEIAVLYAEGAITSGTSNAPNMEDIVDGPLIKEIEKLKNDDKVKAVVFRVNSPGGSAYASEQIWKAISDLKEKKPVVVSMGNYAASGGYYIACNASKIIAQPNTLTGSIGIFGMFPNAEGLTKKIGLSFDNVKTNKHGDFGDLTRPMREDEKRLLQGYIEKGYDLFLTRCADGRGMAKDSLALIAEGRVWTGNQALKLGLIDGIGGVDKAIEEAATLAKLEDYSLKSFPRKVDFFEAFFSTKKEELATQALKEYFGSDYNLIKTMKEFKNQDYVQARMFYDLQME